VTWTYRPSGPNNGFQDWGPVASQGRIYSPSGLNQVVALDAKNGKPLWSQSLVSNVFTVALAEADGVLLATTAITTSPTSTLFGLDPASGKVLWDNRGQGQPALGGIEGAPAVAEGVVYVGYLLYEGSGGMAAFEAKSGRLLWRWQNTGHSPTTSPMVSGGCVVVGFDDHVCYGLDAKTGEKIWLFGALPEVMSASPAASGGQVFVTAGQSLYALDLATGQPRWQQSLGPLGASSLAVTGEWLFLGTRDSRLYAVQVSDGTTGWTTNLEAGAIEGAPAIDLQRHVLYVGAGRNQVLTVDMATGDVLDRLTLGEGGKAGGIWRSSPALYQRRLYIGSLDQALYAIEGRRR